MLISATRAACFLVLFLSAIPTTKGEFTNGGFETGDFLGWTVGGASTQVAVDTDGALIPNSNPGLGIAQTNVRSGTYAANALVSNSNSEILTLAQTLDLEAGPYEIGFFLGHDASQSIEAFQAAQDENLGIFVDGTLIPFQKPYGWNGAGDLIHGSTPASMKLFHVDYDAPGGEVEILLSISGSLSFRAGISIDDAYVTSTAGPELPGDFNLDNTVDAADYAVWRNSLGDTGLTPYSGADANGDGDITSGDYTLWRENFGMSLPPSATTSLPAPEPAAGSLAAACLLSGLFGRRRSG